MGKVTKKALLLCFALLFLTLPFFNVFFIPVSANSSVNSAINKVISYSKNKYGVGDNQSLINSLSADAGTTAADWTAIALKQNGDGSGYLKYITALQNNFYSSSSKETDKERMSLVFASCGGGDTLIKNTLYTVPGSLGIMSYVYGLILADTRGYDILPQREACVRAILSLELDGGGFALFGETPDIDVSAMTLIALSKYRDNPDVYDTIERTLAILSKRQSEYGDYISFWTNPPERNAESCAQLIIALTALGINPETDSRFIKNGNTLISALLSYQKSDGSFSHTPDGKTNSIATAQCLCALVSYKLFLSGKYFYDFSDNTYNLTDGSKKTDSNPSSQKSEASAPITQKNPVSSRGNSSSTSAGKEEKIDNTDSEKGGNKPEETKIENEDEKLESKIDEKSNPDTVRNNKQNIDENDSNSIRDEEKKENNEYTFIRNYTPNTILDIISAAVGAAVIIILIKKKHKDKKTYTALGVLILSGLLLISLLPFGETVKNNLIEISIDCSLAYDYEEPPDNLPEKTVFSGNIEETGKDTSFSILKKVCEENNIAMEYKGEDDDVYVYNIAGLSEFDCGSGSGWMYSVNGVFPSVSCSSYNVKAGDKIIFEYTLNFGNDLIDAKNTED